MKLTTLVLALLLAGPAFALDIDEVLPVRETSLAELGTGIGVIFSPDISVPGNCRFYEALGFACFEEADWQLVLRRIGEYNREHPGREIRTLVLETHGTNGHGLKIQKGKDPKAARSYISVGALQERVEPLGVRFVVLSACNSGRLLRPSIYRKLDRNPGDKLFLPATRGILDASDTWDASASKVRVLTPATSHIETTLVGSIDELAPTTRLALERAARYVGREVPKKFAVSDMLIRMLLRDPQLRLREAEPVEEISKTIDPASVSERRFQNFVTYLNWVAAAR